MTTNLSPIKLLTIGAILALLALSVGGALADRIGQRASGDRLSFGAVSCDESAVAPSATQRS